MPTPIANGCDAFTVPSGSVVAATGNAQLTNSENWSSAYGTPISGNMKFFMGYCDVMTSAEVADMNAAGIGVLIFYENTIGAGPSGSTPGYYAYWTYAQGYYDGTQAQISSMRAGIPLNRPVYFTVDALPPNFSGGYTTTTASYVQTYFSGVLAAYGGDSTYIGLYSNPFGFEALYGLGYVSWLWQTESLSQPNNSTLSPLSSGWQLYNNTGSGPAFYLSNGSSDIDGDFAYQSTIHAGGDYGQYGGGSSPTYGQQTSATATVSNSFSHPQQITYISTDKHDRVIYSKTITDNSSVTNTVGLYTIPAYSTGINQTAYPMGIFSYDGGDTWNDFGYIFAGDYGAFPGTLPNVVIQPVVGASGDLSFEVALNVLVPGIGSGANVPIIIKIALMASYSPSELPASSVTQPIAWSNNSPLSPENYATYRRISQDVAVSGSGTITHDLGVIPNILFWTDAGGDTVINPVRYASYGTISGEFQINMDATGIYYYVDPSLTQCYIRIFKDN